MRCARNKDAKTRKRIPLGHRARQLSRSSRAESGLRLHQLREETESHLYAYAPSGPPQACCEAVSQLTSTAATLEGEVNPKGNATGYRFQYTTESDYQANGWADATSAPAPEGEIAGNAPATVSEPIGGLAPGTAYRFRLIATSHCNPVEPAEACVAEGPGRTFAPYPEPPIPPSCPNAALRTGASAALPDCRAYELVTPPDTNGVVPWAMGFSTFDSSLASPGGDSLMFGSRSGAPPALEGNGAFDAYEAVAENRLANRRAAGKPMRPAPPARRPATREAAVSPDHGYAVWQVEPTYGGSLEIGESKINIYVRIRDGARDPVCPGEGHFQLVGCAEAGFKVTRAPKRNVVDGQRRPPHLLNQGDGGTKAPRLRADAPPFAPPTGPKRSTTALPPACTRSRCCPATSPPKQAKTPTIRLLGRRHDGPVRPCPTASKVPFTPASITRRRSRRRNRAGRSPASRKTASGCSTCRAGTSSPAISAPPAAPGRAPTPRSRSGRAAN